MSDWGAQVDNLFGEMAEEIADKAVRKVGLTAYSTLVTATPVDTGRARNAWQMSTGSPSSEVPAEGLDHYPPPDAVPSAARKARVGDQVFIVNNVEYVGFLDDGSSGQAPGGMTSVMVAQLEAQFGVQG